ncbi:MAG: hypothetical protein IKP89_04370 [Bacteroidales bacterium]|nr:hypothetical protein [Bacteroidales bacterium]
MSRRTIFGISMACVLVGMLFFAGCEKERITNENNTSGVQEETALNPIVPDSSVKEKLDDFFSKWEDTVTVKFTDCINVINGMDELKKLGCDNLKIDFNKYSLIWGKVMAYHTGYSIQKRTLYYDGVNGTYRYDVILHVGDSGYGVVYGIYFWDIFPKKNYKSLALNVKTIKS